MRHHNSVFHGILKLVPWGVFEALVDKHGADHRVRRLDSKSQFIAMLFGQLSGASSLREIEAGLESHAARLYHLGGRCVARSTLADANARRPWALYGDVFAHLAAQAGRPLRRQLGDGLRILDATRIELCSLSSGWLDTVNGHRAIKLHIAYDPGSGLPVRATTSDQRVNDITPAKAMPIEPGMTYVFDLAYYDFAWWGRLHAQGCRFVTRIAPARPPTPASGPLRTIRRVVSIAPALPGPPEQAPPGPGGCARSSDRVGQDIGASSPTIWRHLPPRCRPLQAALADRAVLQMDQAEPQNPPLPGHVGKCRAHPDLRRPDRLSAAAHRSGRTNRHTPAARLRPPGPPKPHASTPNNRP